MILRLEAVGIRCADHVTPSTRKSRHYFADSGGRSVGIVRLRTKATEFFSFRLLHAILSSLGYITSNGMTINERWIEGIWMEVVVS
jgi:hypothetical protein